MFPFPGISLHLSYLTWFSFSNAMKNTKKPETQDRWIGGHHGYHGHVDICIIRVADSAFVLVLWPVFGGVLEGRGRLSAPESVTKPQGS